MTAAEYREIAKALRRVSVVPLYLSAMQIGSGCFILVEDGIPSTVKPAHLFVICGAIFAMTGIIFWGLASVATHLADWKEKEGK